MGGAYTETEAKCSAGQIVMEEIVFIVASSQCVCFFIRCHLCFFGIFSNSSGAKHET